MTIQEHFKKFYDMEPYIFIDEKEWQSIMETYEKLIEKLMEFCKFLNTEYGFMHLFVQKTIQYY